MKKSISEFKITYYDKFKCIADKCRFTCCSGWDISVDDSTFKKWNEKYRAFTTTANCRRIISKKTEERCPFLDKDNLCLIVKDNGDEYISDTCRTFPRIINSYNNRTELSLSCACPEVVDIIANFPEDIVIKDSSLERMGNLPGFDFRGIILNIMKDRNILLKYRMILCYSMLLELIDCCNKNQQSMIKVRYNNRSFLNQMIKEYENISINCCEALEELNNLFIDITDNYRNVDVVKDSLKEICSFAEEFNQSSRRYKEFELQYKRYDKLNTDCIISKIYNINIDNDITEIAVSFEMIVIESILSKYALFLKYCIGDEKEIKIDDVKDYITVFSRIISSNYEAVRQFIIEGFESELIDIGYLSFISFV